MIPEPGTKISFETVKRWLGLRRLDVLRRARLKRARGPFAPEVAERIREEFLECLYGENGNKLDLAQLTAEKVWRTIDVVVNRLQIGHIRNAWWCGTSLHISHFSLADDRFARKGFGMAMAEGLRALALRLKIERIYFAIRTAGQGQEAFFLKLGAKPLPTADDAPPSVFRWDIDTHGLEVFSKLSASQASALEGLLICERMLIALMQTSHGAEMAMQAIDELTMQYRMMLSIPAAEVHAEGCRTQSAVYWLKKFKTYAIAKRF
jgi:hypothetical protein